MPNMAKLLLPGDGPQPTEVLGRVVRARREALGISQETYAERASLSRTYVGGVERGQRNPTTLGLYHIATGLGISTNALMAEVNAILAIEMPWLDEAIRRGRIDP